MRLALRSALVLSLAAAALAANAALVVVAPTATGPGLLTITSPIDFRITAAGDAFLFDITNWVTSDGSRTFSSTTTPLAYAVNGTQASVRNVFVDNLGAGQFGDVLPNDGYISPNSYIPVKVGDTLSILAGTYALNAASGFNQQCTQTFAGTMFVVGSNGATLSAPTSVGAAQPTPEPSALAALALGAIGLLRRRKRA